MPTAGFVINRTRVRDAAGFRRRCQQAAAASGWDALFLDTTTGDRGLGLARAAVAAGAGLVFAAGGDGTVRACAQALAGTRIPLAILPMGTANLAARALGVPTGLPRALAAGFGGSERRIDLAVAEGMTFAAMAGIGLDAAVVGATPQGLKDGLGWLAYAGAGVLRLPGRPNWFTVQLDDEEPLAVRARSVVAGNAGLLPGGFTLLPGAQLDDGLLDVGVLGPTHVLGWLRVAHRVLTSSRHDDRHLTRYRARQVRVTADADLPRQIDGEVITPGDSLTVSLLSSALTVRVPAAAVPPGQPRHARRIPRQRPPEPGEAARPGRPAGFVRAAAVRENHLL